MPFLGGAAHKKKKNELHHCHFAAGWVSQIKPDLVTALLLSSKLAAA